MATAEVFGPYEQWSMVLVYDRRTGGIVHAHQEVTAPGGTHPDATTMETKAAGYAAQAKQLPPETLACLQIDPRQIDYGAQYTVDVTNRSLRKA
jgi:hypothetical protein